MTGSLSFDIEIGRVSAIDMLHNLGQISPGRFDQKMVMIVHKAVYVNNRAVAFGSGFKIFEKFLTITPALEYSFALIAPGRNVVESSGVFYA